MTLSPPFCNTQATALVLTPIPTIPLSPNPPLSWISSPPLPWRYDPQTDPISISARVRARRVANPIQTRLRRPSHAADPGAWNRRGFVYNYKNKVSALLRSQCITDSLFPYFDSSTRLTVRDPLALYPTLFVFAPFIQSLIQFKIMMRLLTVAIEYQNYASLKAEIRQTAPLDKSNMSSNSLCPQFNTNSKHCQFKLEDPHLAVRFVDHLGVGMWMRLQCSMLFIVCEFHLAQLGGTKSEFIPEIYVSSGPTWILSQRYKQICVDSGWRQDFDIRWKATHSPAPSDAHLRRFCVHRNWQTYFDSSSDFQDGQLARDIRLERFNLNPCVDSDSRLWMGDLGSAETEGRWAVPRGARGTVGRSWVAGAERASRGRWCVCVEFQRVEPAVACTSEKEAGGNGWNLSRAGSRRRGVRERCGCGAEGVGEMVRKRRGDGGLEALAATRAG
ncbi:hypothetical protein R3P38DRAFT_3344594 [Favolaschia claudopus]|uniref:Uncharacterized protein n=1 Tax=Favolaschia claudopus TaxID=2862362 RepID=A0AAW0DEA3_9AGAR